MKAKKLIKFLKDAVEIMPKCECYINGFHTMSVKCDDEGDVDLYTLNSKSNQEKVQEFKIRMREILEENNINSSTTIDIENTMRKLQ